MNTAMKRLPMPASGNSSCTCSGVSMISLSRFSLMISTYWLEKRRPYWEELEKLLARCGENGVAAPSRRELRGLSMLYRQIASDLSILRQDQSGLVYSRHLNQLLARAHNIIY